MSQSLINLEKHGDEMRVSSRQLSEGVGTSYKATNNLIRKHQKRLETFGELPFKKALKGESSRIKPALLNEDQATFLVTLSRNTKQVVDFKHRLVSAFSKLRRKQALIDANHATVQWQQNRALGKLERRDLIDSIQLYVNYATAQGSRGAGHYFSNITRTTRSIMGIKDRDGVSEQELHLLSSAECIVEKCLLECMAQGMPYKTLYGEIKRRLTVFRDLVVFMEEPA